MGTSNCNLELEIANGTEIGTYACKAKLGTGTGNRNPGTISWYCELELELELPM